MVQIVADLCFESQIKPTLMSRFFYLSHSTKVRFLHVPKSKKVTLLAILLFALQFGQTYNEKANPSKGLASRIHHMNKLITINEFNVFIGCVYSCVLIEMA